eukprot:TRINITY_DN16561_c0_g1_i1.p1 TRINITY_DN16561_c0_g1~~TRINITY_DN16561_c0_g1_i1.p1  ORF type:complete len:781 (-),score=135.74 TRINITY_DN16561_c0_g1_i1:116-2434(-)
MDWPEAYAERLFRRYPEVFVYLGDPGLPQQFDLPPVGCSSVKLQEFQGHQVLNVELGRRFHEPSSASTGSCLVGKPASRSSVSWNSPACSGEPCHSSSCFAYSANQCAVPDVLRGSEVSNIFAPPPRRQPSSGNPPGSESDDEGAREPNSPHSAGGFRAWGKNSGSSGKRPKTLDRAPGPSRAKALWGPRPDSDEDSGRNSELPEEELCAATLPILDDSSDSSQNLKAAPKTPNGSFWQGTTTPGGSLLPRSCRSSLSSRRGLMLKLQEPSGPCPAAPTSAAGQGSKVNTPSESVSSEMPLPYVSPTNADRRRTVAFLTEQRQPAVQLVGHTISQQVRSHSAERDGGNQELRSEDKDSEEERKPRRLQRSKTSPSSVFQQRVQRQKVPRVLPGAFPSRRTVIFFDWDDTLCPTSWIRSLLKEHLDDMEQWVEQAEPEYGCPHEDDWRDSVPSWFKQPLPDEPAIHQLISDLQEAVMNVIEVAQAFGVVCIVTNAVSGWVEKTIKRWLPQLRPYIGGQVSRRQIKVLYAQQAYVPNTIPDLGYVDDQGEYMWWKKVAIDGALNEVDSMYGFDEDDASSRYLGRRTKRVSSIISIGDSEAEMRATELAGQDFNLNRTAPAVGRQYNRHCGLSQLSSHSHIAGAGYDTIDEANSSDAGSGNERDGCPEVAPRMACCADYGSGRRHSLDVARKSQWPWVKLVKLRECSHVRRLTVQLEEIAELLPEMIHLRRHQRVDLSVGRNGNAPRSASELRRDLLKCSNEDLLLEKRLRVQTL